MNPSLIRTAFVVGRAGSRAGSSARRRNLVLCVSILSLSLALMGLAIAGGVLHGIAERDAARAPRLEGDSPVGYVLDTFATPPLHVVLAQPAAATDDSPPPGTSRWPAPGEAVVSTEVAKSHPVGTVSPWGTVTGVIGDAGLVNPNEQYVYANPRAYTVPREDAVYGWGADEGFGGDHQTNLPAANFLLLMGFLLVVPAAFAVTVATRLQTPQARRAMEVFEGFGAGRGFRAAAAAAGVFAPSAAAIVLGWLVAGLLVVPRRLPLPVAGVVLQHEDIVSVVGYVLLAPVVAVAVAVATAIHHSRPPRRRATPALGLDERRSHARLALAAPVSLLVLSQLPRVAALPVWLVSIVALLTVGLYLFSVPFVTTWIVGRWSSALGATARSAPTLVAARLGSASTRSTQVMAFGLVVATVMFGLVDLYSGYFGQEARDGQAANAHIASRMLLARTPRAPEWTPGALSRALRAEGVEFLPLSRAPSSSGDPAAATLEASCAQLESVGARRCSPGSATPSDLRSPLLEAAAAYLPSDVHVVADRPTTPSTRFLAVRTDGRPLDAGSLNASGFSRQIRFQQLGDEWAGSAEFQRHQLRWPVIFVVPGMLLLIGGLLLGAWLGVGRRLAALRPLLVIAPGTRLLRATSAATLLLPLLVAVVVAVASYLALGLTLGTLYDGLRPSLPFVTALTLSGLLGAGALWAVATAHLVGAAAPTTAHPEEAT